MKKLMFCLLAPICFLFAEEECCKETMWFVSADFLWWKAAENNLPIAMEVQRTEPFTTTQFCDMVPGNIHRLDRTYSPGFRAEIGAFFPRHNIEVFLRGLGYWNCSDKSLEFPPLTKESADGILVAPTIPGKYILDPWRHANEFLIKSINNIVIAFTKTKADRDIDLYLLDLGMEKKFCFPWFEPSLSFGLSGAISDIDFKVRSTISLFSTENQEDRLENLEAKRDFHNCFYGIGAFIGAHPEIPFGKYFSIFGNFNFSLLFGKYELERKDKVSTIAFEMGAFDEEIKRNSTIDDHYYGLQPILDFSLGAAAEFPIRCTSVRLSIAWENQIWLEHIQRVKTLSNVARFNLLVTDPITNQFGQVTHEMSSLYLYGLTVQAQVLF